MQSRSWLAALLSLTLIAAACSGDDATPDDDAASPAPAEETATPSDEAPEATSSATAEEPTPSETGTSDDPPPESVVERTLKVGYAYPDVAAFAVLDDKFSIGDPEIQAEAVVQAWRRDGLLPVNGTDIQLVFGKYNILSTNDKLGVCTQFAQDEEVFAVISGRNFEAGAECLAERFQIPVIDASGLPASTYDRTAPWLFTVRASESEVMELFAAWAAETGAFDGKRIGLFWDDRSGEAVETFKDELTAIGQELVSDLPSDGEGIGSPQDAIAVPRFVEDGADLAILLVSTSSVTNFLASAEAQGYEPELLWLEWANQLTDVSTQAYPQALVDGTLAMTMSRLGSIAAGEPLSPQAVACIDAYEAFSGEDLELVSPESGETNNTLYTCDLLSILYEGLRNAGDDPTAESLVASLEMIQDFPLALWGDLSFGPGDHAGVEQVRTVQWRTACECWTALDEFRDPRG